MKMGRHSYREPKIWGKEELVEIGSFCSIARNVTILSCNDHHTEWASTFPFNVLWKCGKEDHPTGKGKIIIGHDVWIGYGSIILSGVTVGNGAVIAAGSVVVKDVRPYTINAGNPAREVRQRFHPKTIQKLQELQWWNWPDEKICKRALFLTSDPEKWAENE